MNVAIFDIDGTLTDTTAVDMECFVRALREELHIEPPWHWHTLDDVTDSTILAEACRVAGKEPLDSSQEAELAEHVGQLLNDIARLDPARFSPIPGAAHVLDDLRDRGWKLGMATGAWRPSALVKLRTAELPTSEVPLVTSSEFPARAAIIGESIRHAAAGASVDRVVYFGDGVWDGRAAEAVGCHFVGIGSGERAVKLADVGAGFVTPDFSDLDGLMAHLSSLTLSR